MLPIKDDQPRYSRPYVNGFLIGLNIVIFLFQWFQMMTDPHGADRFAKTFGEVPAHLAAFLAGSPKYTLPAVVVPFFTSMFLHGSWMHVIGNMWFLWMFGNQVERILGRWVFCLVYLGCGLGGDLLHYLFNSTSAIPSVGASGAISGIAGCFFVLFPKANFDLVFYFRFWTLKTIHTHTAVAVGAWIAEQALLGVLSLKFQAFSVAFWAHVGGFAVGLVAGGIALILMPRKKKLLRGEAQPAD